MKQAISDKVQGGMGRHSLQDQYPVDTILESKYLYIVIVAQEQEGECFAWEGERGCLFEELINCK